MWQEFSPQGLVLLALSDEGKGVVERFAENNPMPYPVGMGCQSGRFFKVRGIPAAFLIDHRGDIIWQGHPGGNGWVEMIPKALEDAAKERIQWDPGNQPELLKKAVQAAVDGKLGKAWSEANKVVKVDESAASDFHNALQDELDARKAYAETIAETGRYYEATLYLNRQIDALGSHPTGKDFKKMASSWAKSKDTKNLLKLDKKRYGIVEKGRFGDRKKAADKLRALAKKAEGTPLADVIAKDIRGATR